MTFQHLITPQTFPLAAGIASGMLALALVGLLIWNRRLLASGMRSLWRSIFSQGGLFYLGMALFMLASVVEAGPVLNQIVMHGALFGYGGQLLVFAFDMIAAVSLRARLNARRVFDTRGMKLQMWGIWLPALVSVAANLAGAIQHFNAADFNHLFIFAWLLPLIGAVFPSMIVVLSLAADHLIDSTAITTKIDVEEFKQQERKRIDILKVRLSTERELLEEEEQIATLRRAREEAQHLRPRREWVFLHWLRREHIPPMPIITATIEQAVQQAREQIEQQTSARMSQLSESLFSLTSQLATTQQELAQQIANQAEQLQSFPQHLEALASTVEGQQHYLFSFSSQLEEVVSTMNPLLTFKTRVEVMAESLEHLTTTVETLKREAIKERRPHTHESSRGTRQMNLQSYGDTSGDKKERAFHFIADHHRRHEGADPTLPEIMAAVGCSQGSASNYRSEYRQMQETHTGDVAVLMEATNSHAPSRREE